LRALLFAVERLRRSLGHCVSSRENPIVEIRVLVPDATRAHVPLSHAPTCRISSTARRSRSTDRKARSAFAQSGSRAASSKCFARSSHRWRTTVLTRRGCRTAIALTTRHGGCPRSSGLSRRMLLRGELRLPRIRDGTGCFPAASARTARGVLRPAGRRLAAEWFCGSGSTSCLGGEARVRGIFTRCVRFAAANQARWQRARSRLDRSHRRYRGRDHRRCDRGLVSLAPRRPTKATASHLRPDPRRFANLSQVPRCSPSSAPTFSASASNRSACLRARARRAYRL
jgi:hypothetical protein